jgi:hypothetical protein
MRAFVVMLIGLSFPSLTWADGPDEVRIGMDFSDAQAVLKKHECEVGECKLAIVPRKDVRLACGPIDDEIELLVGYNKSTNKVSSLSVYFIPGGSAPKLYRVYRSVSKLVFEDDHSVALTIKRRPMVKE